MSRETRRRREQDAAASVDEDTRHLIKKNGGMLIFSGDDLDDAAVLGVPDYAQWPCHLKHEED